MDARAGQGSGGGERQNKLPSVRGRRQGTAAAQPRPRARAAARPAQYTHLRLRTYPCALELCGMPGSVGARLGDGLGRRLVRGRLRLLRRRRGGARAEPGRRGMARLRPPDGIEPVARAVLPLTAITLRITATCAQHRGRHAPPRASVPRACWGGQAGAHTRCYCLPWFALRSRGTTTDTRLTNDLTKSGLRMNLRCLVRAPEYFWKVVKARRWSGQRGAILECEILRHNSQVWDFDPSFMHEWSEIPIDKSAPDTFAMNKYTRNLGL